MNSQDGSTSGADHTVTLAATDGPGASSYVDVVVDGVGPLYDRLFTYRWPPAQSARAPRLGEHLRVPWGKGEKSAIVMETRSELPDTLAPEKVKEVAGITGCGPLLEEIHRDLAVWLKGVYFATWPAALGTLLPGPLLKALREGKNPRPRRKPRSVPVEAQSWPELTPEQAHCWQRFQEEAGPGTTFLLEGVTGSGKTELYLRACRRALENGKCALVLVPEVALTPQVQQRFRARFGEQVSILHSGLTDAERRGHWWRIRDGEAQLVVGTRSAVFAPLENLGLIVLDEEHDASYKNGQEPRYHARQVASWLATRHGATLMLGSATPSLESVGAALEGRFSLLRLTERVGGIALPEIEVRKGSGLDGDLYRQLEECAERGEQSVLLVNRRGFAPYLLCENCGWVPECRQCSISLTYHKKARLLKCHYCAFQTRVPDLCSECGDHRMAQPGIGTERIEAELRGRLPNLRVARLDRDVVGGRGQVFEETFSAFGKGEFDCLLGTQMVAKGLDFPKVSLVIVLEADTGLHLPDFRATERTFALLIQVAGRAGRSSLPGRVVLVSRRPEHKIFEQLKAHDWQAFAQGELALRRELGYPPYRRLVRLLLSDPSDEKAERAADELGRAILGNLGRRSAVELLGPAPCPLERLHGRYRWHLILKGPGLKELHRVVRSTLQQFPASQVRLNVDPDPLDLL